MTTMNGLHFAQPARWWDGAETCEGDDEDVRRPTSTGIKVANLEQPARAEWTCPEQRAAEDAC